MMGSASTPGRLASTLVRQEQDLVALPAQRPWSSVSCCAPRPFRLRNTPDSMTLLRTRRRKDCATAGPMGCEPP